MLQWFERVGYSADIAGLERGFGRTLTKLPSGPAATRDQTGVETFAVAMALQGVELSSSFVTPLGD